MPNPYDGIIGYNRAVDDAIRTVHRILYKKTDPALINLGGEIVLALAGLYRKQRTRRWAKRPADFVEPTNQHG